MTELTEKSFTERELVTVSHTVDGNTITATQDYSPHFDSGHYKYVVMDNAGNVIQAYQTICGAPTGKLDESDAQRMLESFLEEKARFG